MARVANSWIVNGGAPFPMREWEGWSHPGAVSKRHPSRHPWNSCVPRRRINTHTHPTKGFPRSCPFFLSFLALSSSSIVPCPRFPVLGAAMSFVLLYLRPEHHHHHPRTISPPLSRLHEINCILSRLQARSLAAIYFEARSTCRIEADVRSLGISLFEGNNLCD